MKTKDFKSSSFVKILSVLMALSVLVSCAGPIAQQTDVTGNTTTASSATDTSASTKATDNSTAPSAPTSANTTKANTTKPTVVSGANLKVHFLNVGQGDSIFIELPNKQTMLIDAGDNDGSMISQYIESRGYSTINYLVATHPHSDHIGGMADVINGFEVKNFYMPKVSSTTRTFENVMLAIQNEGCGIKTAKAGVDIFNTDNLKIQIVAPVSTGYDDVNNYSAVIKLTYGSTSFLFTGDAGTESESQITANVNVDVLKVGHHGSRYSSSSSFLQEVSPTYAVISCGAGNSYGHPHAETLSKLKNAGIKVYRTDLAGTIIFTSNGNTISVNKTAKIGVAGSGSSSVVTTTHKNTTPSNTKYIGNLNTHKFHLPSCSTLPDEDNRIYFNTRDAAVSAGYVPCKRCNP